MGGGAWSAATYAASTGAKIGSGTNFGYHTYVQRTGQYKAHDSLDPKKVAGPASPFAGQNIRESRDNDEHPNSTPIILGFDSTGSMGRVPRVIQEKLSDVFGLLLERKYVDDPQIMIATYGDAYVDSVPLQVSQFESDNRIDDNLDNLFLEGGGGGNGGETASMLFYYAAHHTVTDSMEKRDKKGYMFVIADEVMLDLTEKQVDKFIGDGQPLGGLTAKEIAADVSKKWDVYILLIDNMSAKIQGSEAHYKSLFGEDKVLVVENPDTIAETISLAIGVLEGRIDTNKGADDLRANGSSEMVVRSATRALAPLAKRQQVDIAVPAGAASGAIRL